MSANESMSAPSLLERGDLATELRHMRTRLVDEFAAQIPTEVVDDQIENELAALGDVRIRHFVPLLVERQVRRRLRDVCTDGGSPSGAVRRSGGRPLALVADA